MCRADLKIVEFSRFEIDPSHSARVRGQQLLARLAMRGQASAGEKGPLLPLETQFSSRPRKSVVARPITPQQVRWAILLRKVYPAHPDFNKLTIGEPLRFRFDPRLISES